MTSSVSSSGDLADSSSLPIKRGSEGRSAYIGSSPARKRRKQAPIPQESAETSAKTSTVGEHILSTPQEPPRTPTSEKQKPFTPKKRYTLAQSPSSGRIRLLLTPGIKGRIKKKEPLLYSWKRENVDKELERRLIGTSAQADGRIARYVWGFNHPEKVGGDFSKEVSENPEEFSVGIIRNLAPGEDSKKAETEAIIEKDSIASGYNKRLGGGGGQSQAVLSKQDCPYTIDEIVQMIREEYESPIKQPLRRVKGKLKIDLSKSDKKMKNVIYEFLFDPTDQKEDRIHHPGFTSTTLQQRMSAHQSVLNAPQSLAFQNVSLYKEVSRRPDQVFVRRFNIEALLKKGIPLPMLERAFMQFFKERGEKVRNIGAGGKGSVSKDAQHP